MLTIGAISLLISLHLLRYDEYDLMEIVESKHKPSIDYIYDSYDNEEQVEESTTPETPKSMKVSEIPNGDWISDLRPQNCKYYSKHFHKFEEIKGKKHIFQYLYDRSRR